MVRLPFRDHNPETFPEVTKDLRTTVGMTQVELAKRIGVTHPLISQAENAAVLDRPSAAVYRGLLDVFPEETERVRAAYEFSLALANEERLKERQPMRRRIDGMLQGGRYEQAERALAVELAQCTEARQRFWLSDRLATVQLARGRDQDAVAAMQTAIDAAEHIQDTEALVLARNRLAKHYQGQDEYRLAHDVVIAGLARCPDAALLWLRKAFIHWYEHDYASARSALAAAESKKALRRTLLHTRAQVLAEWGQYDEALRDIAAYRELGQGSPISHAYLTSAEAYVLGHTGDLARALKLFAEAEATIPECGWLYYRRALCQVDAGSHENALPDLARALECSSPRLNLPKREHANRLLADHGPSGSNG